MSTPLRREVARAGAPMWYGYRWTRGDRSGRLLRGMRRYGVPDTTSSLQWALTHAARTVPYWSRRLGSGTPEEFVGRMRDLAPLTKSDIRSAADELRSRCDARGVSPTSSGGSTGEPITVLTDQLSRDWSVATQRWFFERHLGVPLLGVPQVILWGSEADLFRGRMRRLDQLRNGMVQTRYLNSFGMSQDDLRRYCSIINRVQPVFVRGYAGSLYELSRFAIRNDIHLHRPRFVYTSAETLSPIMREVIGTAFRSPVNDFYGSREVGPISGEDQTGELVTFPFLNYVEVVDSNGDPTPAGSEGRVLVTTLRNSVMPLIRYELGDTAVVGARDSSGSVTKLRTVRGRISDQFLAESGQMVHGEFFTHLFYGVPWVDQFHITQKSNRDVLIRWVRNSRAASDSDRVSIDEKIRRALGYCEITWLEVAEIPPSPTGKRLFTFSELTSSGEAGRLTGGQAADLSVGGGPVE